MSMTPRGPIRRFTGAAILAAATSAWPMADGAARTPIPQVAAADSPAVVEFKKRVDDYVAVHRKLEATLPALPDDATPEQIDNAQRTLFALLKAARPNARQGDLFTPGMTAFVKELLGRMLEGPAGQRLRASLMDENVKELPLTVNQRYPDAIPLATMPPRLLKALPALPEQMEFRFVASQFILLDTHAHLVVDFIPDALPGKVAP
jgi:hypothetical protein